MPTPDQSHSARLHGEALAQARDLVDAPQLDALLGRLADATDSPAQRAKVALTLARQAAAGIRSQLSDDERTELARKLIAAGLILESGPVGRVPEP